MLRQFALGAGTGDGDGENRTRRQTQRKASAPPRRRLSPEVWIASGFAGPGRPQANEGVENFGRIGTRLMPGYLQQIHSYSLQSLSRAAPMGLAGLPMSWPNQTSTEKYRYAARLPSHGTAHHSGPRPCSNVTFFPSALSTSYLFLSPFHSRQLHNWSHCSVTYPPGTLSYSPKN